MSSQVDNEGRRQSPAGRLPVILASMMLRLMSLLPFRIIYALGVLIGESLFQLYGSRRNITKINLSKCFPDLGGDEIHKLARGHFHALTIGTMSTSIAWWGSVSRLESLVTIRNHAILEDALAAGRNIILLAPHFAGLEFLGLFMSSRTKCSSMYQKHKNPAMDKLIFDRRSRFGSILFDNKSPTRNLIRGIRSGTPFYYLPDQDPGPNKGVFAKFYGIETATYPALSRLAKMGDAVVIPCLARLRTRGRGYEVIFDQPLENYPSKDEVADATNMNHAIEKLIAFAPEQYFWSHKRFKTRPRGEPSFYTRT